MFTVLLSENLKSEKTCESPFLILPCPKEKYLDSLDQLRGGHATHLITFLALGQGLQN